MGAGTSPAETEAPYRAYPSCGAFSVLASAPSPFLNPAVYIVVDFGSGPFEPLPSAHGSAFSSGPARVVRRA